MLYKPEKLIFFVIINAMSDEDEKCEMRFSICCAFTFLIICIILSVSAGNGTFPFSKPEPVAAEILIVLMLPSLFIGCCFGIAFCRATEPPSYL